MRLILASASPQRRKILTDAGFIFESADPGEVEGAIAAAPTPEALAIAKARAKAQEVALRLTPPFPALVIGTDTLVAINDEVVGKPLDRMDAQCILRRLSGTRHRVISGLCLWPVLGTEHSATPNLAPRLESVSTWVRMRALSNEQIEAYVASGQSDDKAGAYAIQSEGEQFVEGVEGSFLNVVGFPLEEFQRILPETLRNWNF